METRLAIVESPMKVFLEILNEGEAPFIVNDFNKQALRKIFNYFVYPNSQLDKRRGIMLIGNCGTGKTRLMRHFNTLCARFNGFPKFRFETVKQLQNKVIAAERRDYMAFYEDYFSQNAIDLLVDDIGTETKQLNYFGNVSLWFEDFICERYNLFENHGIRTHVTTNLNPKELQEFYSARVYDRMKAMFNVVMMSGESWRGKKAHVLRL